MVPDLVVDFKLKILRATRTENFVLVGGTGMTIKLILWAGLVALMVKMENSFAGPAEAEMEEHVAEKHIQETIGEMMKDGPTERPTRDMVSGGTKEERVKMHIRATTEGTKEQLVKVDLNRDVDWAPHS